METVNRTPRQLREIEFHATFAAEHAEERQLLSFEHLENPGTRWWNHSWRMYEMVRRIGVKGKKCLVVGCGFGSDAICLAKMGGDVSAFDLSPDELQVARQAAENCQVTVDFRQMPAEALTYADQSFDLVLVVDILHHCEVLKAVSEIRRVTRSGGDIVINEIYTHTLLGGIRRSWPATALYPRMVRWIYGTDKPYITSDERPLDAQDLRLLRNHLSIRSTEYFYFVARRLFPDRFPILMKLDRLLMILGKPLGPFLAGRVLAIASPSHR